MTDTILVAAAWPYANAEIHAGNLAGSYLPADIYARFQRLRGHKVLMVSGTDSHGTPITIRADSENTTPFEVYQRFHKGFLELFQKLGLTYDIFTSTHTENHFRVAQSMFLALKKNGLLYAGREMQWYSPSEERFLPDRYVEGTCYICGYQGARSDQCDQCGNLLDPEKLIDPRSKIGSGRLELRETEHFYLDLSKLQPEINEFLEARKSYWRPNVLRQSLGQIEAVGLRGRPITRDLDWGVPVPLEGWENKCLYVWFEAVIGYLSSAIEWSRITGQPDAWRQWWQDPNSRTLYFIGKDNIPFHAIIWPGELIGAGETFNEIMQDSDPGKLVLPFDVPANEFLNLEGQKISGSRNWAVWGLDFLSRYDPDALRYYLTVNMPESKDTDWDWDEFIKRNNDELVATWGNLANRVLSFAFRHWEGEVPEPGNLTSQDQELIQTVNNGFETVGNELEAVHLRFALSEVMRLASEVNRYLDQTAPWSAIKTDKDSAGRSIYTAIQAINSLKIMFSPFLPFSSETLHTYLGYEEPIFGLQGVENVVDSLGEHAILRYYPEKGKGKWQPSELKAGSKLCPPAPLFRKLESTAAEAERARLGKPA